LFVLFAGDGFVAAFLPSYMKDGHHGHALETCIRTQPSSPYLMTRESKETDSPNTNLKHLIKTFNTSLKHEAGLPFICGCEAGRGMERVSWNGGVH
jgi:hypothetical protein